MNVDDALAALRAHADPEKAAGMASYHKADREYLGLSNAITGDLATQWRKDAADQAALVALAQGLWDTDIFEARIAAGKLFLQARMRPDDTLAWGWITSVVPQFDSWAIADAVAQSAQKRLVQDPSRLDLLEEWTQAEHLWTRRAAFVFTLSFVKSRHPSATEKAARDRVLNWAAALAQDPEWFIQKAIAWWLRDLSKRDQDAARIWLEHNGDRLKPFAAKEAARYLP
ncbi:DNA alkylation repair protein [Rhodobacteraceae bacterium N5(2021)]|uniref:DNA alkylation repair protein n=1 Tax=Gymnodinialimonas phycosphaerae TaxID=2841589 RepID=A0A975TXU2_9RHOB|nr:DNA alkylation repair protein [Gymnodinialimonas phycosphaerae]MBY4892981.1 DNA alkylation repair protein [Gymnodinialimonas phycosphaerae]